MALLYDPSLRAVDANGLPLVGATLTIKNAGTNTLANVYRDAGLTTAMSNPLSGADAADGAGRFPQVNMAEAVLVDMVLKDAAGDTIATYESVEALGSGATVFVRDFGNSRARIAGSGGIVRYEAGDPIGDDVGGQVAIGGYAGTQADTATIDAALTNTTGSLTVGGKKLPGVVSSYGSVTAATEMVVALPNAPSGVCAYDVDLINILCSAAASYLYFTVSYDNGATYESANYHNGALAGGSGDRVVFSGNYSLSGNPVSSKIHIATDEPTSLKSVAWGLTAVASHDVDAFACTHTAGAAPQRITHIKVAADTAAAFAGKYRVVPAYGTGDA